MFKFKGISSKDMQVVIEEEEHFIARAARRYETIEIEGRDGAIFEELGYSYVERPIYVQCLNVNKIDNILAWLDGEGEFEYKGRKTTARFYSELEPQREGYIRIIDTTFIRDPFWTKLDDEYIEVKGRKDKTTEKSSNINVKDSSNLNAKIGVFGISKQETRSGKNKFNIEKLTGTNITDKDSKTGAFKMSNCWGIIVMDNASLQEILKPNTQYKCIADVTLLSKPDDLNASNSSQILSLYNNQDVVVVNMLFTSNKQEKDNWEVNTKKHLSTTFTTPADLTGFSMIGYNYRTERATNEGSFKFENIMILEATEDDESFEEAGETPSPEIPSEIKNVTGDINVITTNENLAVADWAERFVNVVNNNSKARLEETDGRKCLFYNADAGYQNDDAYFFKYIFKKNTRYTISFYIKSSTTQGNFAIKYTDGSIASVQNLVVGEWQKVVIYTKTNATVEEVRVQYLSGNCRIDLDTIQITESTTEQEYIKNQGQTITFPLAEGQRLADRDKFASDGIHHKRKQITITEDMLIQGIVTTYTNLDYIRIKKPTDFAGYNNPKANISLISFAKEFTDWTFDSANYINKYTCRLQYAYFMLGIEKGTTYAEIKDKLIGQTIEYELAEEEIEPYAEEQQEAHNKLQNVLSYYNVTNVFTDKALLVFKYIADTTEKIENEGNVYSRPILRLEKTICNEVDIMIEDLRFQYNFNDEEYVEIDCEEKEVKYEGLNRNRKIQIGYEFPKLKVGENEIKMYEGDCIIKAKRKDRWL